MVIVSGRGCYVCKVMPRLFTALLTVGLLVSSPGFVLGQTPDCCQTCSCEFCSDVLNCGTPPGPSEPSECSFGGSGNCGLEGPLCSNWTDNNPTLNPSGVTGNPCVPIDGGLVVLIAGGLGMAFVSLRRRQSLELMTCAA